MAIREQDPDSRVHFLGLAIQLLREDAGISQRELAERVGWRSGNMVSRYEQGLVAPTADTLSRIADALGVKDWAIAELRDTLSDAVATAKGRYPTRHLRVVPDQG